MAEVASDRPSQRHRRIHPFTGKGFDVDSGDLGTGFLHSNRLMKSSPSHVLSRRAFLSSVATAAAATTIPVRSGPDSPMDLQRIARLKVHPALGVARVGNSSDAFFFFPEVPASIPDEIGRAHV